MWRPIRALLPNENILGICHFRTTQFNYAKTTVDPARSLLQVKAMNGRTTFEMKSVELDLLDGLKATEVILGDSLEGAKTEISADGKHVTVTAANGVCWKPSERESFSFAPRERSTRRPAPFSSA